MLEGPDTTWFRCEACDDMYCAIHDEHVFECPCPPLDLWVEVKMDPYEHLYRMPAPHA